jgi:hypothetical protein
MILDSDRIGYPMACSAPVVWRGRWRTPYRTYVVESCERHRGGLTHLERIAANRRLIG